VEFLDKLSDYQLLKKYAAPWSYLVTSPEVPVKVITIASVIQFRMISAVGTESFVYRKIQIV
jgi:hypothetical protein